MTKINMELLSPVHIGSGVVLRNNQDFFIDKDYDGDHWINIIDLKKVQAAFGDNKEIYKNWAAAVSNENFKITDFIHKYAPNLKIDDCVKDPIPISPEYKKPDDLKLNLHTGLGKPYIPGTSIKGAIKTVLLTALLKNVTNKEGKLKNKRGKYTSDWLCNEVFAKKANEDFSRFIRVGDAYFDKLDEIAIELIMGINVTKDKISTKNGKSQVVLALYYEAESAFDLKIEKDYSNFVKSKHREVDSTKFTFKELPEIFDSIEKLFKLINKHTKDLVESEIKIIEKFCDEALDEDTDALEYLKQIKRIHHEIVKCDNESNSCVLRMGHGSGWRSITGAWAEDLEEFDDIARAIRGKSYDEYDFPKSRRTTFDYVPLGFVKLTY